MCERAFLVRALVCVLHRVRFEAVDAENKQHDRAWYLQQVFVVLVIDEVHDETHAEAGNQSVENVARCGSHSRDETKPAAFVQSALNTQYSDRTHRSRSYYANEYALDNAVKNIYMKRKR